MKKILKISSLAFLLITGIACENDDQKIVQATGGPELLTPVNGAEYVLLPQNASSEVTTLVWNHADYTQQTEVNYEVEVAKAGTDFAEIVSGGTTTDRFMVWTVEGLNNVALSAGLTPFTSEDVDIRIKASLGSAGELVSYSNVVTLTLTPFTNELPKLYAIGNFLSASGYGGNWSPAATLPALASSGFGETDFEGYVYMNVPAPEFKILPTNTSFDGDYGDDGTFSGALAQTGESNIALSASGYYRVQADTEALSYSTTLTNWGIAGNATTNGWDGMLPMTYNATTKKWSIIATLSTQAAPDNGLKFKANGAWDINLGDNGANGSAEYNGTNIGTTAGTYLIELDLSNPRDYKYTLTPQ
ncbi:SusE domain-containing protein [Flavobacterium sp.]|jgi:hypothetical protein|uniref:SusE domain-containing protein n=1 Tax=Flavobacterium sp. TaxID=239 RepID=UPI000ECEC388|nr:SusE domain-containing protein [Flavobacterium sp.]HCQ12478.1 DUF5116 domain-containing protein [Flavobacterium sp.]